MIISAKYNLTGYLTLLIIAICMPAMPSRAFGSPTEAGAAAWCGARQRGQSIEDANRQLRNTMSAQIMMSTDFASAIVGTLNNREGMQSQIDYYISRMCPEMLNSISAQGDISPQWDAEMCRKYPESGKKYCNLGKLSDEKVPAQTIALDNKSLSYKTPGVIGIGFDCISNGQPSTSYCEEVFIRGLAKGGAAEKDGRIRRGDKLLEVNGQRVKGKTHNEISLLIGGDPGTYVLVVIDAEGFQRPITLLREKAATTPFPK